MMARITLVDLVSSILPPAHRTYTAGGRGEGAGLASGATVAEARSYLLAQMSALHPLLVPCAQSLNLNPFSAQSHMPFPPNCPSSDCVPVILVS